MAAPLGAEQKFWLWGTLRPARRAWRASGWTAAEHRGASKAGLVNGGADIAQQFLNAGLLDEVRLHLVPVILGAGTRLFDGVDTGVRFVPREAQSHPAVTHLVYDLMRPTANR